MSFTWIQRNRSILFNHHQVIQSSLFSLGPTSWRSPTTFERVTSSSSNMSQIQIIAKQMYLQVNVFSSLNLAYLPQVKNSFNTRELKNAFTKKTHVIVDISPHSKQKNNPCSVFWGKRCRTRKIATICVSLKNPGKNNGRKHLLGFKKGG